MRPIIRSATMAVVLLLIGSSCLSAAAHRLLAVAPPPGKAKTASAGSVDFAAAGAEAIAMLQKYLQIDTTNPPGNEKLGAEYLAGILRKNGISATIYDTGEANRACVYARLKGTGKKRAVVLLNHIDVVPAQASDWDHPPFGGEIHNGEIWGRGAMDMKGTGIAQLECMLLFKRSGKLLDRDIIFLATPDEEVGGKHGAQWFTQNHPELVKDAEFLFNEGFFIDTDNKGKSKYWGVDISEKSVLWLKLTARGDAGHASMPMADSCTNRLVKGLNKIVNAPPAPQVLPAVREYFQSISKTEASELKQLYENIDQSVADPHKYQKLLDDKLKSSMLRNTVSLTVLNAGYKTNVIPAEATAELDCRLLPTEKSEAFIEEIKKKIDDPSISISILDWVHTDASPYNTEAYEAIKSVAAAEDPGAPVVPVVVPWFTDSHWFRDLGITAYGFEPFKVDQVHLATMHGKNERIPVKDFEDGIRLTYLILKKLCLSN